MKAKKNSFFLFIFIFLLTACIKTPEIQNTATPTKRIPATKSNTATATILPTATFAPTPQPHLTQQSYGIELDDFPANYNPLTGLSVSDPSLLELPAMLVSISNIPASARPQAGISFASWVFEYYIGEATTRFLSVFYGEYPREISNIPGNCPVNEEIVTPTENWLGNRVWLDENSDGIQDDWEAGVGGICAHLYQNGEKIQSTSTNSNGYYAFKISDTAANYFIEFEIPDYYKITLQDVGYDELDSDVDADSKRTHSYYKPSYDTSLDLGLILLPESVEITPTPPVTATYIPEEAYVGPIRSGRLTYDHINNFFPQSCLVFAGAAPDIFAQLTPCKIVFGVDSSTPNSALLTVAEMRQVASEKGISPNYSGNLFDSTQAQNTKEAASLIHIFYHQFNQSAWQYDPISKSYLRFTDDADGTGILHPATDRLTGRQQSFENIIILQATHDIFRINQLDIDLRPGKEGFAYLFRDNEIEKIRWSTGNRAWEKENGKLRPIHFVDAAGNPIALRPGKTWIHLVTLASSIEKIADEEWRVNFSQP
ncbi:MAG: DUF3048 domain-containing protein [Anaerolineae bacterium]|jgi:hypothetical protein|nr:DUF3048 domain-containing protein [Anaerolineae bacterium]MBT7075432.1 DUF3048 domain-containing protein [Anaerolineae bacterium]MBT7782923.1 DUF3048 domain-containing protein [Anaerolineae bacterium]